MLPEKKIDKIFFPSTRNLEFKTLDTKAINFIAERIDNINDKITNFTNRSSQVMTKLMTLQMTYPAGNPYRVIHQIMANIEKKQSALMENIAKMKLEKAKIEKLKEQPATPIIAAQIELKETRIKTSVAYIESAIKEIGYLFETYEEVLEANNIDTNWTEKDFEEAEIKATIQSAFRSVLRHFLVNGRIGMGAIECVEQIGISPFEAIAEVRSYIELQNTHKHIPDYDEFHAWLDAMYEKYKDSYKKACKRLGVKTLISDQFTRGA